MKVTISFLVTAIMLAVLLSISGCATLGDYTASTEIKIGEWYYKSTKNQQDVEAEIGTDEHGRPKGKFKTSAAMTPEYSVAATAAANLKNSELLLKLFEMIPKNPGALGAGS